MLCGAIVPMQANKHRHDHSYPYHHIVAIAMDRNMSCVGVWAQYFWAWAIGVAMQSLQCLIAAKAKAFQLSSTQLFWRVRRLHDCNKLP